MARKLIYVKIIGQGIMERVKCVAYEVEAHPATTYHVFTLENGATVKYNDFGVRSLTLADSPEKLD